MHRSFLRTSCLSQWAFTVKWCFNVQGEQACIGPRGDQAARNWIIHPGCTSSQRRSLGWWEVIKHSFTFKDFLFCPCSLLLSSVFLLLFSYLPDLFSSFTSSVFSISFPFSFVNFSGFSNFLHQHRKCYATDIYTVDDDALDLMS